MALDSSSAKHIQITYKDEEKIHTFQPQEITYADLYYKILTLFRIKFDFQKEKLKITIEGKEVRNDDELRKQALKVVDDNKLISQIEIVPLNFIEIIAKVKTLEFYERIKPKMQKIREKYQAEVNKKIDELQKKMKNKNK